MGLHFETLLARHGEHGIQAILENWERFQGLKVSPLMTLEMRWDRFVGRTADAAQAAA